MRRHLTILLCASVLFSGSGIVSAQGFLGKDMATWARDLDSPREAARRGSAYALGKLGSEASPAVPGLIKCLKEDGSAKVRDAAAFALGEIGRDSLLAAGDPNLVPALVAALKDADGLVRRSAAYALGNLGADAASAVDALNAAQNDDRPEVRQNVANALGKMGVAGLAGLRNALRDSDNLVQRDAAAALASFDPQVARPALSELLPLCAEKNSEVRKAALIVLVRIVGPDDKAALAPIRQALADPDPEVRVNAALALSNIGGKEAAAAVAVLLESLRGGDLELRRQAAAAIRNIGPEAKSAVPDLIKALRDPDNETRTNAALALGGIGAHAEAAVASLVQMVGDTKEKSATRIEAAVALQSIGPVQAAVRAVPSLLRVLENPVQDISVRERVVWSLRAHKTNLRALPGVASTFTKVVSEPADGNNKLLRYDCAYMLGAIQNSDVPRQVMDVLLEYLKDDTIQLFDAKKSSVGGTGQEANSGKADVKELGRGDGRVMAADALKWIGPRRLAERRDIIQQLEALAMNPATNAVLRDKCKAILKSLK
jgi:HEAT repeat protein